MSPSISSASLATPPHHTFDANRIASLSRPPTNPEGTSSVQPEIASRLGRGLTLSFPSQSIRDGMGVRWGDLRAKFAPIASPSPPMSALEARYCKAL